MNNILIISGIPMRNDTNLGKTLSTLFSQIPSKNLSQLYFNEQIPNLDVCNIYFQITDRQIIKSFLTFNIIKSGKRQESIADSKVMNNNSIFKKYKKSLITIIREIMWKIPLWKNRKFKNILEIIQPKILFVIMPDTIRTSRIALYIKKHFNTKMIVFVTDDYYNSQINYKNILYSYYLKLYRKSIDELFYNTERIIGCSDEASKYFGNKFKLPYSTLLTPVENKFLNLKLNNQDSDLLIFRYFGNLGLNRWKILREIGLILKKINVDKKTAFLEVYSITKDQDIIDKLNINNGSKFCGFVKGDEYLNLLENANIVLHVESFDLENIQRIKLSISTKITDYLGAGKCILAVGPDNIASLNHIKDVAVTVNQLDVLETNIRKIIINKEKIIQLQNDARKKANTYHNQSVICKTLRELLYKCEEINNENMSN